MFSLSTQIWGDVQEKIDCPTDTYRTIEPNLSAPIHMVAHSVIQIHIHAYMRIAYIGIQEYKYYILAHWLWLSCVVMHFRLPVCRSEKEQACKCEHIAQNQRKSRT